MKKFLLCLFAAMLIVPAFSGCGDSTEATIAEEDPTENPLGEHTDESYEAAMNKGMEEHEGEE